MVLVRPSSFGGMLIGTLYVTTLGNLLHCSLQCAIFLFSSLGWGLRINFHSLSFYNLLSSKLQIHIIWLPSWHLHLDVSNWTQSTENSYSSLHNLFSLGSHHFGKWHLHLHSCCYQKSGRHSWHLFLIFDVQFIYKYWWFYLQNIFAIHHLLPAFS